jgi:hypothetical protein
MILNIQSKLFHYGLTLLLTRFELYYKLLTNRFNCKYNLEANIGLTFRKDRAWFLSLSLQINDIIFINSDLLSAHIFGHKTVLAYFRPIYDIIFLIPVFWTMGVDIVSFFVFSYIRLSDSFCDQIRQLTNEVFSGARFTWEWSVLCFANNNHFQIISVK